MTIVLEDYVPSVPRQFLSEVPLQFLIEVVDPVLNCDEKPVFVDTPLQPHCFAISETDTFTLDVTVKHSHPNHTYTQAPLPCSVVLEYVYNDSILQGLISSHVSTPGYD